MPMDELFARVSDAILHAERLEDSGDAVAARAAHLDVSILEEELADLLPATASDGQIARWGAVHAAIKAEVFFRARDLAERYANDAAAPRKFTDEMRRLYADTDARVPKAADVDPTARFSHAA